MKTNTATQQKAAYVLLTSARFHNAIAGDMRAANTIDNCLREVTREMTLPTLQESIELVSLLVWPKYSEVA
jgi:hypothetical protein